MKAGVRSHVQSGDRSGRSSGLRSAGRGLFGFAFRGAIAQATDVPTVRAQTDGCENGRQGASPSRDEESQLVVRLSQTDGGRLFSIT